MTDLVLTYLDNSDETWRNVYNDYKKLNKKKQNTSDARWRSWDNFKYVMRSIAENMKFINKLYIVVSSYSQVPEYINTDVVNIVTHNEIIPRRYLPVFNSNTIELFIYKIPELSEQFIYSNDDIFAIRNINEDEFFNNGMPRVNVRTQYKKANNLYTTTLNNTEHLASDNNPNFICPREPHIMRGCHSMNPMLVSMWKYYWNTYSDILRGSLTRFRNKKNITQELSNYEFYMRYVSNGTYANNISKRRTQYFIFNENNTSETLKNYIENSDVQLICINDNNSIIEFDMYKNIVIQLLKKRFPNKCKYEK